MARKVATPSPPSATASSARAAQQVEREQQPEPADADGHDLVVPGRVVGDQADGRADAPLAAELARHLARLRQRVQRLADHDHVGEHPQQRRNGHEQRQPGQRLAAAWQG